MQILGAHVVSLWLQRFLINEVALGMHFLPHSLVLMWGENQKMEKIRKYIR
jgi:hypothetical protein